MNNEEIVRDAYHAAEGNVLDAAGFAAMFSEKGVFNNKAFGESYEGERLGQVVDEMGALFSDIHRELLNVHVIGDVVAVELLIQGTFTGPFQSPAGVIQPTGAKVNIPTADFFYLRDGKIDTFNCYLEANVMFAQLGIHPDFATALTPATVS